jgi:hypothetical protein
MKKQLHTRVSIDQLWSRVLFILQIYEKWSPLEALISYSSAKHNFFEVSITNANTPIIGSLACIW